MAPTPEFVMRAWFQELWNKGDETTIARFLHANAVVHGLPTPDGGPIRGPAEFTPFYRSFRATFPGHFRRSRSCRFRGKHGGGSLSGRRYASRRWARDGGHESNRHVRGVRVGSFRRGSADRGLELLRFHVDVPAVGSAHAQRRPVSGRRLRFDRADAALNHVPASRPWRSRNRRCRWSFDPG